MEEKKQTFGLRKNINKAAAIRSMCQTEGFKVLQEEFKVKTDKVLSKILDPDTSDDEVLALKRSVRVWTEIQKTLKELMLRGELCKRALDQLEDLNQTSPEELGQGE